MRNALLWTLVAAVSAGVGSAITFWAMRLSEPELGERETEFDERGVEADGDQTVRVENGVDDSWPAFRASDPRRIQELIDRGPEELTSLFAARLLEDVRRMLGEPDRTASRYRPADGGLRFIYYGVSRPKKGARVPELRLFFMGDRVHEVRLRGGALAGR